MNQSITDGEGRIPDDRMRIKGLKNINDLKFNIYNVKTNQNF